MIWREKKWLLISLGAVLLANLLYFVTYRVRYEERVNDLEKRLSEAQDKLQRARNERVAAETELATYRATVKNIETVFSEIWSTSDKRLAPLIVEIGKLTSRSGLTLKAVGYDRADQKKELGASSFGVSFGVQGTYGQLRRLINFIEISRQFIIIDEISLSSDAANPAQLYMNLRLKTLFHDTRERQALGAS